MADGFGFDFRRRKLWICIGETWGVFTLGDTRKYCGSVSFWDLPSLRS